MSYKTHLHKIIEAKNNNKLVFFIGSGMSKNVGLPDWGQLVDELKNDLKTSESDFLKIAQLYFLEFGEYEYIKKVRSFFPLEKIITQTTHTLLVKIFPQYIITTNWDAVIEKAIDDEMALYDIVRNDSELINTTSNRKLIKMHGDIEIGNIIFKEDDYLEYSQKFPLIENYVKSILSTNTVVFLGYSYNDINLKYITKWIQKSAHVRPPAYMIVFKEDKIQEKYFKNHGITVLNISNEYVNKNKNSTIEFFLNDILTSRNIFARISKEHELIDAFYCLLKNFDSFNIVLIDQLSKLFKENSIRYRIDYDNSERVVLHLQDYYSLIDNLFKSFRTIFNLKQYKEVKNKLKFIINILHRSGIVGLAINIDKYQLLNEKVFNKQYNLCNYNFDVHQMYNKNSKDAYLAIWNNDYEQAYTVYKELIILNKTTKNYTEMFLLMNNANIALILIKNNYFLKSSNFKNSEPYNIGQLFLELKENIRMQLRPLLFTIIDDSLLYKYMYDVKIFHENIQEQVKIIQNGGMVFSNNETEAKQKHKNLLYFVNNNFFCIDIYEDFKNIQIEFIKTTLTRQFRNEYKTLEKFELYSCIKYIKTDKLKNIFDVYLDKDCIDYKKFKFNDTEKNYLEYLLNTIASTLEVISHNDLFFKFQTYWVNVLYLLSLAEYANIANIISVFSKILKITASITIYREINLFLRIQKYVFGLDIKNKDLFELLEITINKIISSNYDKRDTYTFENYALLNYLLNDDEQNRYSNLNLINLLLDALRSFDAQVQENISKYFLLTIYDVSDDNVRNSIKSYILSLNIGDTDKLMFNLFLLSRKLISYEDFNFNDAINKFIDPYLSGNSFSPSLYELNNILDYLVYNDKIEALQQAKKNVTDIIDKNKHLMSF